MARRYALRDDQWARIAHLLPGRVGHVGGTAADNRLFVDAVLSRYRAGRPRRSASGSAAGRWAACGGGCSRRWARTPTTSTPRSTPRSCAPTSTAPGRGKKGDGDEAIGRSRGGLRTTIHAVVDALGNPVAFHLTGGQAHDLDGADALLANIAAPTVIADKGYDAEARVLAPLREAGKVAVIKPRHDFLGLADIR